MSKQKMMLSTNIFLILLQAIIIIPWPNKYALSSTIHLLEYAILISTLLNICMLFLGITGVEQNRSKYVFSFIGTTILMLAQLPLFTESQFYNSLLFYIPNYSKSFIICTILLLPFILLFFNISNHFFTKESDSLSVSKLLDKIIFILSIFIIVPDLSLIAGSLFNIDLHHTTFITSFTNITSHSMQNLLLFPTLLFLSLILYSSLFSAKKIQGNALILGISGVLVLGLANILSYYFISADLEYPKYLTLVMFGLSISFISLSHTLESMFNIQPIYTFKSNRLLIKTILPYIAILVSMITHFIIRNDHATTLLDFSDNILLIVLSLGRGLIIIKESIRLKDDIFVKEVLYEEKVVLSNKLESELAAGKEEVDRAKQVHSKMLPNDNNLALQGIQIVGGNISAKELGGDYYDIFKLDDSKILIVLCDVMGKGLSAAMLTVLVRNAIKHIIDKVSSASCVLNKVNEELFEDLHDMKSYVTIFAVTYDLNSRELAYSSAGHNPLALIRGESLESSLLRTKGTAIGLKRDVNYIEESIKLNQNDIICIYSDGLIDARNSNKEKYGSENLINVIRNNVEKAPEQIKDIIIQDVKTFSGNEPQKDDITLVVIKTTA